jgi:hypothetical protein
MLPLYLWLLMNELGSWLAIALSTYMLFQIGLVGVMALTGRQVLSVFSGALTTIYLFGAHAVLLFGPIKFDIPIEILIIFIIVFSLPQFAMYLWKLRSAKEFQYPIAKLLIRLTFVHGYLSAVLLTRYEPITGITVIMGAATLFVVLRVLSSRNAAEEHSVCIASDRGNNIITSTAPKSVKMSRNEAFMAVSMAAPGDDCNDCCTDLACLSCCCICPCAIS